MCNFKISECVSTGAMAPDFVVAILQEWFDSYLRVTYGEDTTGGWGQWESIHVVFFLGGVPRWETSWYSLATVLQGLHLYYSYTWNPSDPAVLIGSLAVFLVGWPSKIWVIWAIGIWYMIQICNSFGGNKLPEILDVFFHKYSLKLLSAEVLPQ